MPEQGLIFIPDISGFSRFVTRTEIDHSRLIVQELLETLIEANEIGLEVSEIEGDAILFYRYGDAPPLEGDAGRAVGGAVVVLERLVGRAGGGELARRQRREAVA